MLELCELSADFPARTLTHSRGVFHEALEHVQNGERAFRVTDGAGSALYSLRYTENQQWAEKSGKYVHSSLFRNLPLYPPYLRYDEDDAGRLCLDLFQDRPSAWLERADEYSVTLARILLRDTDKTVYIADDRIRQFLEADTEGNPRLRMASEPPEGALRVYGDYVPASFDGDFSRLDSMTLFHHVFFFQWLTPLSLDQVKYVEFLVPKTEGIGSILLAYGRGKAFFGARGMQVTIQPGCTRYPDRMLEKLVRLPVTPPDADETNTIRIVNYYSVMYAKMLRRKGDLDLSVLQPAFREDLETYADAVIGNRKMLGVLLRGSDYVASAMGGSSRPRGVAEVKATIRQWMQEGGYDRIFLATEDQDLLEGMCEAFPGKVLCVAQERYRVSDFQEGMRTISELDRFRHPGEAYERFTEDATVNYLYAIYMLSRCEAFMYSCHCGGVSLARQLRGDPFRRMYSFADDEKR